MAMITRRKSGGGGVGLARKDSIPQKCLSNGKTIATARKTNGQFNNVERIRELENHVAELKKRLDDLRKAKSQTIIKKDKEYISLDTPKLGQRPQGVPQGSEESGAGMKEAREQARKEAAKEITKLKDEIRKLKIDHAKEIENLKSQNKEAVSDSEELIELRKKCKVLQEKNDSLEALNTEQTLRIDELYEQLSKKEAEWCDKEEKLERELKSSWGEKYLQWMAQTEQKIEELQAANNFLKMIIQRDRERSSTTEER